MPSASEILAVIVLIAEITLMFLAWRAASRRTVAHAREQGPKPHAHDHPGQVGVTMLGIAALTTAVAAAIRLGSWELSWANMTQLVLFGVIAGGMAGHSIMMLATRGQLDAEKPRWAIGSAVAVAAIGGAVSIGWVLG